MSNNRRSPHIVMEDKYAGMEQYFDEANKIATNRFTIPETFTDVIKFEIDMEYVPDYVPVGVELIVKALIKTEKNIAGRKVDLKTGQIEGSSLVIANEIAEEEVNAQQYKNTFFEVVSVGPSCFLREELLDLAFTVHPGVRVLVEAFRPEVIKNEDGKPTLYYQVNEAYIKGIHKDDLIQSIESLREQRLKQYLERMNG